MTSSERMRRKIDETNPSIYSERRREMLISWFVIFSFCLSCFALACALFVFFYTKGR